MEDERFLKCCGNFSNYTGYPDPSAELDAFDESVSDNLDKSESDTDDKGFSIKDLWGKGYLKEGSEIVGNLGLFDKEEEAPIVVTPEKKDNTMMFVGIGAGVLILGLGVYLVTKKK